ncbi:acyltransferase [Exiguobacterium aurantiacum]|uniref:acyltransferase n=1 Tax=Exiguobacterium aurantiacum TaxID=33987 RepID=UPI0038510B9E
MRGRDKFNQYKGVFDILVNLLNVLTNKSIKIMLFSFFRNVPGNFGIGIRYVLIKSLAKKCGDNVSVHPGVYLFNIEELSLGSNISIHPMCYIDSYGEIFIEDNVSIAHGSTIMSSEHIFQNKKTNIKDQGISKAKTIIESNVWIGAGSKILAGVKVSMGTIIGAGSIVTKDTDDYSIYVGVPAKKIKSR